MGLESEDEDEEVMVTTRVLSLSRCDTLDPATRTVTQIQVGPGQEMPGGHGEGVQVSGWGDHSVPATTATLLHAITRVQQLSSCQPSSPVLVHCSAGVI